MGVRDNLSEDIAVFPKHLTQIMNLILSYRSDE